MLIASSIAALALPANTASYVARPDLYSGGQRSGNRLSHSTKACKRKNEKKNYLLVCSEILINIFGNIPLAGFSRFVRGAYMKLAIIKLLILVINVMKGLNLISVAKFSSVSPIEVV